MAINQVYPPIVNSSSSAFSKDVNNITINFSVPMIVSYDKVKHISIRVVQQSNNKTVVDTDTYYDGIIYKEKPTSNNNGIYSITIDTNEIKTNGVTGWEAGTFYKIQIRFGYGEELYVLPTADETTRKVAFYKWKKRLTSTNSFSEWSNVIITKAITPPEVTISNNLDTNFLFTTSVLKYSDNVEHTRFPKFEGCYSSDSSEPLDKYRYRLYEGRYGYDPLVEDNLEPYLDSGWLQYDGGNTEEYTAITEYRFKQALKYIGTVYYTVFFDTISLNEYHKTSIPYTFTVTEGVLNSINHIDLVVKDNTNQGNYAARFEPAHINVFSAYKKLMELPMTSTYLYVNGTDIVYSENASRAESIQVSVKDNDKYSVYLGEGAIFPLEEYRNNNILISARWETTEELKNENGEPLKDSEGNILTITKEHFSYFDMDSQTGIGDTIIEKDYFIDFPTGYSIDNSEATLIQAISDANNKNEYCDLTFREIDNNGTKRVYVKSLTFRNVIQNGTINVYRKQDMVILTQKERMNQVSQFEKSLQCDENGTLEIWIRNNPYYVEVEKFDDVSGFNNYEMTSRMQTMDGIYYLIRSDERSNYGIWEDLAKFDFYNKNDFDNNLKLLYEDFTIESGIKYKYALQRESLKGFRSPPRFEFNTLENSPEHWSNFQYTYIYANGVQVRLDLDVKIQQFKHTRLFQKQDPLNSKYPVILRNGIANYGEFSLGGKITLHSDADGSFFLHKPEEYDNLTGLFGGGYYYNGDLIISPDKYRELASRTKIELNQDSISARIDNTKIIGADLDVGINETKIADGGALEDEYCLCTIIDVTTADEGYYKVIYEDKSFSAYVLSGSGIKYRYKDKVYVRVPKGDFSQKKMIIGLADAYGGALSMNTTTEYYFEKYGYENNYKQGYSTFDFNHTNNNIFMERMYRKYVEEFLNDGGYKLYKSPYEGNMIVTLVNTSLVPNQQLGRLIADFNSTVYEVAENTCDNIKLYDINPLDVMTNNMYLSFEDTGNRYRTVSGQVSGAFDGKYARYTRISADLYQHLYYLKMSPVKYFTFKEKWYESYENLPQDMLAIIFRYFENLPQWRTEQLANLKKQYNDKINALNKSSENYSEQLLKIQNWYNIELHEIEDEVNIKNITNIGENPYFDNTESDLDNIMDSIRLREEVEISDERIYRVNNLSAIWVELYPKYNLQQEIINLKANRYGTKVSKLIRELKIAQYEQALEHYDYSQSNVITLIIDGQETAMMPGRIYHLDNENIKSIYLKYTRPILINYVALLEEVDNLDNITLAKQGINNLGQVAGVFTTTEDILDNHYPYRNKDSYIGLEKYNYGIYQTLSVYDVIKEKVKSQILDALKDNGVVSYDVLERAIDEFLEKINSKIYKPAEIVQMAKSLLQEYKPLLNLVKNSTTDVWIDDKDHIIIYNLQGLEKLEIEADENTGITFNNRYNWNTEKQKLELDDSRAIHTIVGPTEKYILQVENTDTDNELDYIFNCEFDQPTYSIINYNAVVSLEIKGNPMNQ